MYWQYRTILFEYQKDGLLGDKYIDDEELEKTLNDQGNMGWELVAVTPVEEGLLAFLKRIRSGSEEQPESREAGSAERKSFTAASPRTAPAAGKNIRPPEPVASDVGGQAETSTGKQSRVGEIKIS